MRENLTVEALRTSLDDFVRYRREFLEGDEKGEAQVFLERLFRAFGHEGVREAGATLEQRVRRRDEGGTAFADLVWKPRVLIEMKKGGEDLRRHYRQAFEYWIDLVPDRPEYVVLCNFDEFWVYDLNLQLDEPVDRTELDDLPRHWEALAFLLPVPEEPVFGNDLVAVTRESAALVSAVFNHLVSRNVDRAVAQRFILQAVMAMFAEDIGLLPRHSFTAAVRECLDGGSAYDLLFGLFREMNAHGVTPSGRWEGTPYFNGGLFREIIPFELERQEVEALAIACQEDWAQVKPVIFGTLFEQSLEKPERHAYGAYFTSETDIQKVVLPTIVRPWRDRIAAIGSLPEAFEVEDELLRYRVLDPACGSGNFLYVAYRELRRLEKQLHDRIASLRRGGRAAETRLAFVATTQFFGIDIRPFAVEVAKLTLMLGRKLASDELGDERNALPLDDLDGNFHTYDGLFSEWPEFSVCIGNPPYLGRNRIVPVRGADYAARLRETYPDVGGRSDYVSYFFRKAHDLMRDGQRTGFVGTNSVREGDTRVASLDYIVDNDGVIYEAVSSQPWSGDAAVKVSIVNWAKGIDPAPKVLWLSDGTVKMEVDSISGSLSPTLDLRRARKLKVNGSTPRCFEGQTPGVTRGNGFVLKAGAAEKILEGDSKSAEVIHPFLTGRDIERDGRPRRYVIDIPVEDALAARQWKGAFDYVQQHILPVRQAAAEKQEADNRRIAARNPRARLNQHHIKFLRQWWQLSYRREEMWQALAPLTRYIVLSRHALKDRPSVYLFVDPAIHPGDALQVFAFDDDYSFGILQSSWHRRWFEERASSLGDSEARRYTSKTIWNTFPWPQAPTDGHVSAVVAATADLLRIREEYLGSGTTLGDLYDSLSEPGENRLRATHDELDQAVAAAYGFTTDDDPLAQLLALNESIFAEEDSGLTLPRSPGNEGLADTHRTTYKISI